MRLRIIVAVILVVLIAIPVVAGATLECPAKAPADKVVCRLEGNGTGKLYLQSVDGLSPRAYLITIRDSEGYKHSINDEWDTFKLPANISFSPGMILSGIKNNYFVFVPNWVLFNKEHTFTFVLIGKEGTRETFDVRVYVEGKPDWGELEDNLIVSLIASSLVGFMALGLLLLATWKGKHKNEFLTYKFAILSGVLLMILLFEFYFLGPNAFGLLYYYFGSGTNLHGDIVFGLSIWMVVLLITTYLWVYVAIPLQLASVAYKRTLNELRRKGTYPIFGLSWILLPLLALRSIPSIGVLLATVGFVLLVTGPVFSDVSPRSVFLINLTITGLLTFKFRPDYIFTLLLAVLLFVVYLIQRKCFYRFNEEKERLIGEIEEKVRGIRGIRP